MYKIKASDFLWNKWLSPVAFYIFTEIISIFTKDICNFLILPSHKQDVDNTALIRSAYKVLVLYPGNY